MQRCCQQWATSLSRADLLILTLWQCHHVDKDHGRHFQRLLSKKTTLRRHLHDNPTDNTNHADNIACTDKKNWMHSQKILLAQTSNMTTQTTQKGHAPASVRWARDCGFCARTGLPAARPSAAVGTAPQCRNQECPTALPTADIQPQITTSYYVGPVPL